MHCTAKTTASATKVPTAAPEDAILGIKMEFNITLTMAPATSEYRTIISRPVGTKICIPVILDKPINKSVGIIICMGTIEPSYAVPDKK